jgi:hypothetical protein
MKHVLIFVDIQGIDGENFPQWSAFSVKCFLFT